MATSLAIVLGLAAVHRYSFKRLLVAELAISLALAAASRFNLRLGSKTRRAGPAVCIPIALVLLGAWRFFRHRIHHRWQDPGVYVNEGIQIAQRGAIVVRDPVVAAVPVFARNLFFRPTRTA